MDAPAPTLQRRCAALLAELNLPRRFDMRDVLGRVSERRGRPLRLLPLLPGLRDEPSGLWIPMAAEDFVFAEGSVSNWYRDHVVLHEVGHMLFDHPGSVALDVSSRWLGQYGVTDLPPAGVSMRCAFAPAQEQEAEMVALLIESRIDRRRSFQPAADSTPAEVAAVLQRLAWAIGAANTGSRA